MKKLFTLTKTLFVAAGLCVGMSAWADATTYDFEDSNVRFSAYNSSKITVAIQENSGPDANSKAVKFAYKSKGAHNFAYLNFSSLAEDASTVNVEFDFYVTTASGHDLITLADADYHTGANAGFDSGSNTGYGSNGAIFNFGCYRASGSNDFAINSSKKTALTSTCLGNWCHANITVDNVGKTVSYTITRCDATELDASASATGVAFVNASAYKCTQIDVYMGATSSSTPIYIDNLVITPTVVATNHRYTINAFSGGSTIKTLASGMVAEGESYAINVPKVVKSGDKYYVLNDANLTNFHTAYTMSTANETHEISYTLDESIVYFVEGESLLSDKTKVSDNQYSSGSAARGLNNTTKNVYTVLTDGNYTITSAVCNNNVAYDITYAFYKNSSENIIQTTTFKTVSVNQVMTTGTKTSDATALSKDDVIKFYAGSTNVILDYIIIRQVVPTIIGTNGYTTISSAYPLALGSMTASEGDVTAYYASTIGESSVTLTSIAANVEAGEGLILKGTAGATITIPVAASGSSIDNYLVGCPTETVLTTNDNYYVLVNNGATAEFQRLNEHGATIPAGKAYLNVAAAGSRLSIIFDDDNTTSISTIAKSQQPIANSYYDLQGRRVAQPTKGLYIVNGKKVVVK